MLMMSVYESHNRIDAPVAGGGRRSRVGPALLAYECQGLKWAEDDLQEAVTEALVEADMVELNFRAKRTLHCLRRKQR